MRLSDLYDADRRRRDAEVTSAAERVLIPHPLHGIQYGDGTDTCTHARRCATVLGAPAR